VIGRQLWETSSTIYMEQVVKDVVFQLSQKKNINYHYANDFNGDGEFHSVLMAQWTKMQEQDPTFASGIGTATFDMNADFKIRDHFHSGKFNPFSTDFTEEAYKD
jgi:hypothetical protein